MKKYISLITSLVLALSVFSPAVWADSRRFTCGDHLIEAKKVELELNGYSGSDKDLAELEDFYYQQNDNAVKSILIIQGVVIGILALIVIIISLSSFIRKQSRKKILAEKQAAYDREKREREKEEETKDNENNNTNPFLN